MSVRLGRFVECSGVLPEEAHHCAYRNKFAYRKGLVSCDALLCMSHTLQSALDWKVSMREGSCGSISVQPLIGSTIRAFSINSTLWVLEVGVVNINTVSIRPTTAHYCQWSLEYTG